MVSETRTYSLIDFGSTFTKVRRVDCATGELLGAAQHRTTVESDLLDGLDGALAEIGTATPDFEDVIACSSAGGGLKIAVIGLEVDLTVAAARQVVLNSGGRVVDVITGEFGDTSVGAVRSLAADLILLVGGTDGGNETFVLDAASLLARLPPDQPVIYAGIERARARVVATLTAAKIDVRATANVLPEVGQFRPLEAQAAIREAFLVHVIKGRGLSASPRFLEMVTMTTPDAVLQGVELMANGVGDLPGVGPVIAVDVGGATTDVYSSMGNPRRRRTSGSRFVPEPVTARTVEGDLGMRWSAVTLVEAAGEEGFLEASLAPRLEAAAHKRQQDPDFVPQSPADIADDLELARLAVIVAVSRHAGRERVHLSLAGAEISVAGRDLRGVSQLVLSGGVFRAHVAAFSDDDSLSRAFARLDRRRFLMPQVRRVAVDKSYVLSSVGLLAQRDPRAALHLIRSSVPSLFVKESR